MKEKKEIVDFLNTKFKDSQAVVLTEYRGLTVSQIKELRNALGDIASFNIAKNTLIKIAAKESGTSELDDYLTGPTAVAFVKEDIVSSVKALTEFAKDNKNLLIKGGYFDGIALDEAGIKKFADYDSREVALQKLACAFKANLNKAAYMFKAPLSKAVRTIDALKEKK